MNSRKKALKYLERKLIDEPHKGILTTKKANRIFHIVRRRSQKKNWSVKKFNIYVLYRLIYGRHMHADNLKRVIVFYSFYWLKRRKRFRSVKDIKVWLGLIDVDKNASLLLCSGQFPIKHLLLSKVLRKKSRLFFNIYNPTERPLVELWKMYKGVSS